MLFEMSALGWCLVAIPVGIVVTGAVLKWGSSRSGTRDWGMAMMVAGVALFILLVLLCVIGLLVLGWLAGTASH